MADRAILFIDGNNWYHSLCDADVVDRFDLDYARISRKLIGPREWVATRYYIGRVPQSSSPKLYADQRRFVDRLKQTDSRISVHFGRLEPRLTKNPLAEEMKEYLSSLPAHIDREVFQRLIGMANQHHRTTVYVEKAVDVMLALDVVSMAQKGEYDAAYILSADGDFTPAAREATRLAKSVYAASPASGMQLGQAVKAYIRLDREWFRECYS